MSSYLWTSAQTRKWSLTTIFSKNCGKSNKEILQRRRHCFRMFVLWNQISHFRASSGGTVLCAENPLICNVLGNISSGCFSPPFDNKDNRFFVFLFFISFQHIQRRWKVRNQVFDTCICVFLYKGLRVCISVCMCVCSSLCVECVLVSTSPSLCGFEAHLSTIEFYCSTLTDWLVGWRGWKTEEIRVEWDEVERVSLKTI